MITELTIKNFGLFSDEGTTIPLSGLTYFVGPNNSGKSTALAGYFALATLNRRGILLPSLGNQSSLTVSSGSQLLGPFFRSVNANDLEGALLGTLLKFQDGKDAPNMKESNVPIQFKVKGLFDGGEASLSLTLSGYPSFSNYSLTVEGTGQEYMNRLYSTLANTWALPSNRAFIIPYSTVGIRTPTPMNFGMEGANVIQFLLERWTDRDQKWTEVEKWLKEIDPTISLLKSPLRGVRASVETGIALGGREYDINIYSSGSGIQRALQIICAVIFSEPGAVIMIEEPEMNLHPSTQEVLFDLFNEYVNEGKRQIVITTHSWDFMLNAYSDIGPTKRKRKRKKHYTLNKDSFRILTFNRGERGITVGNYDLTTKKFTEFRNDFKKLWG